MEMPTSRWFTVYWFYFLSRICFSLFSSRCLFFFNKFSFNFNIFFIRVNKINCALTLLANEPTNYSTSDLRISLSKQANLNRRKMALKIQVRNTIFLKIWILLDSVNLWSKHALHCLISILILFLFFLLDISNYKIEKSFSKYKTYIYCNHIKMCIQQAFFKKKENSANIMWRSLIILNYARALLEVLLFCCEK